MSDLTLTELAAFLATPEAQALATQSEKIAAAKEWKVALEHANQPDIPVYDPVAHLAQLKLERAEWGQAWRQWATDEKKAIRTARMNELDKMITDVEQKIAIASK